MMAMNLIPTKSNKCRKKNDDEDGIDDAIRKILNGTKYK